MTYAAADCRITTLLTRYPSTLVIAQISDARLYYLYSTPTVNAVHQGRQVIHRVLEKTPTRIIGYKLKNSYLISVILENKISHII